MCMEWLHSLKCRVCTCPLLQAYTHPCRMLHKFLQSSVRGSADKSLARPNSHVVGRNRKCRWKERSVRVPNCKSFLSTGAERKHVRRRARFQQHRDASCHQVFFSCKARPRRKLMPFWQTLREHAPSYATVKNWMAQFKRGDFSTCDAPRPGRPKTVITQEFIDQIRELIFEDRRISGKSIAE